MKGDALIFTIVFEFIFGIGILLYQICFFQKKFDMRIKCLTRYVTTNAHLLLYLSSQYRFLRALKKTSVSPLFILFFVNILFDLLSITGKNAQYLSNSGWYWSVLILWLEWLFIALTWFLCPTIYCRKNQSKLIFNFRSFNPNLTELCNYRLDLSSSINSRIHVCLQSCEKQYKATNFAKKSEQDRFLNVIDHLFDECLRIITIAETDRHIDLEKDPIFSNGERKLVLQEFLTLFDTHFTNNQPAFTIKHFARRDFELNLLPHQLSSKQPIFKKHAMCCKTKNRSLPIVFWLTSLLGLISFVASFCLFIFMQNNVAIEITSARLRSSSIGTLLCLLFINIILVKLALVNAKNVLLKMSLAVIAALALEMFLGLWIFTLNKIASSFLPLRLVSLLLVNSLGLFATGIYSWIRKFTLKNYVPNQLIFTNLIATLVFGLIIGLIMDFGWPLPNRSNLLNFAYPILGGMILFLANAYSIWWMNQIKQKQFKINPDDQQKLWTPVALWFVNSFFLLTLSSIESTTQGGEKISNKSESTVSFVDRT